jgi:hypothetical protein
MFQYASLKGIASNRGYEYCIPPKESFGTNDLNVRNSECDIYDVFGIEGKNKIRFTSNQRLMERMHEFDEDLFNNCPDQVDLFGYFQTEKYFKHIEDEIRNDFKFDEELFGQCFDFISNTFGTEVISIHIRRGDYVLNPNHPLQPIEYYVESLSKLSQDLPVLIFSDDPEWCKQQSEFDSDRFLISENNSTDFDLCLMSQCQYHVIANSSFSWWGAWLARSKGIIAPKNWFDYECVNKNTEDMAFGNWSWL